MTTEAQATKPGESMIDIANRLFEELENEVELDRQSTKINTSGQVEIRDERDASRLSGLIIAAQRNLADVKDAAALKVAAAAARVQKLQYLFEGALRQWAQAELVSRKEKRKSIILDRAVLQFAKQSDRVVTESPDTLKTWAEASLPESVSYETKVSLEVVADWEKANGKVAPGRHEEKDLPDNFYVRAPKAAQKE